MLDVALVSRFAWPAVGGTENLVRTMAGELARSNSVRVYAHRIDQEGIAWRGSLDRTAAFPPRLDSGSGVVTHQYRVSRGRAALLAPILFVPSHTRRLRHRSRTYAQLLIAFDRWHARVASTSFADQLRGADIIHRFGGNPMSLATVLAARRLDRAVVITPLAHPGAWDDDPVSAEAYVTADLVVATTKTDALVYERLGVPGSRLAICPLPTQAPAQTGGPSLRARHGLDGVLVLFLGARRSNKGISALIGAASILGKRFPEARIAFVGPGPPLPPAIPENVLDIGAVDDVERDAWLDAADVLCLPSSVESFGLALSEAWSVGVPVVTSDTPVLAERVEESGGGLAVTPAPAPLAEAIATLLSDQRLRTTMGRAGRDYWQRRCSPAAICAWHESAYAALSLSRQVGAG